MPELPEVETVRKELESLVVGKTVAKAILLRDKNLTSDKDFFLAHIQGAAIVNMARKGKCLRFDFDNGYCLYSHLRMEGKYFLYPQDEPYGKFDLLVLNFTDGTSLRYNDVRKFGTFYFDELANQDDAPFSKLGPEPFDVDGAYLLKAWNKKTTPVKIALLDQTVISGIGNIYDSEILFATKIHPNTPVKDLSLEQCDAIVEAAKEILGKAIEEGGSTIRSYHHQGIDGMFQLQLSAYGKKGEPCPRCGRPIHVVFMGGRSSYFCPTCQVDPSGKFILGVTGPIHSGKSSLSSYLESLGYLHFDADKVASSLYDKPAIRKGVKAILGSQSYIGNSLNRTYVRDVLAKSKDKKKKLQSYLYPFVKEEARRFIDKAKKGSRILLDVPLLFDAEMDELCTYTILVDAPLELRIARLEAENRPTEQLAKLNKEYKLESAKKKADFILNNDGSLDDLYRAYDALHFED